MTKTTPSSRILRTATVALLLSSVLSGCATPLPKAGELPDIKAEQRKATQAFVSQTPAIERIRVPKSSMKPHAERPSVPPEIAARQIDIGFPATHEATLESLVFALASENVRITFQWSNPTQGEEVLKKKLPFLSFKGTVGELLSSLRNGVGLVAWYDDGMIYLSDKQRYSVTVPQNEDVLKAVAEEVKELGAENVVTSLRGGKLLYTATPSVQDELIGPFMDRMARNISVINTQVAVVSLALSDNAQSGFDWEQFRIAFDSTEKTIGDVGKAPSSSDNDNDNDNDNSNNNGNSNNNNSNSDEDLEGFSPDTVGSVVNLTGSALNLGKTSLGNVFGTYGALNVTSAISFLSTFGNTNVTQNVSLKTLSGTEVEFQSGQEVPYVKGVSNNYRNSSNNNNDNAYGSTDTDTVETGLKLNLKPLYDADSELITMSVEFDLDSIVRFVELSAGNEIGTLTQPQVQKQNLKDLIQVQAGRTVVIGGLQYDSVDSSGNEPSMIRDRLEKAGLSTGKRKRDVQRNALFIILRPAVTIYEAEK